MGIMGADNAEKRTRKQQREDVISKTLSVSFSLFLNNGFKNTTISMISKESGLNVGSIYNVFEDKDDIVSEMILRGYGKLISSRVPEGTPSDLVTMVSFPMAVQFRFASTSDNARELISMAYSSPRVLSRLVDEQQRMLENYFEFMRSEGPSVRTRLYALNGTVAGIVSSCSDTDSDLRDRLRVGIQTFCALFAIPFFNIEGVLDKTESLIATTMEDECSYMHSLFASEN